MSKSGFIVALVYVWRSYLQIFINADPKLTEKTSTN